MSSPLVLFDLLENEYFVSIIAPVRQKKLCRSLAPIVRGLIEKNAMSATREDMLPGISTFKKRAKGIVFDRDCPDYWRRFHLSTKSTKVKMKISTSG